MKKLKNEIDKEVGEFRKMSPRRGKKNIADPSFTPGKAIATSVMAFLLVLTIVVVGAGGWYTVGAGERAVLLTFGNPDADAKASGFHFKIPVAQKAVKMEVRTQKYEAGASAASKDLQIVSTNIAVNYHLSPESVPRIYREMGVDYRDRVIQPAVQEVVKAITAGYTAENLITNRPQVKQDIEVLLKERLVERGILVEEISITNFEFSASFNEAIEAKVTAEQLKLKAEMDLQRIEVEARQLVASATGKAESIMIESKALKENPDVLQLRFIEKWNGIMPTYLNSGSGGSDMLLTLPMGQ